MRNLRRLGQTGSEYAMIISTVVVAVAAAGYVYAPIFRNGVTVLALDVSQMLEDHGSVKQGYGVAASSASGGGNGSNATQHASQTIGRTADSAVPIDNADGGGF